MVVVWALMMIAMFVQWRVVADALAAPDPIHTNLIAATRGVGDRWATADQYKAWQLSYDSFFVLLPAFLGLFAFYLKLRGRWPPFSRRS